ncbi:MAG: class I SAM-dependent methyltransferase [Planctomycetes bacterium]|nr:class I SAM-dependent methyltransferase [Planctomycetota bacterium]
MLTAAIRELHTAHPGQFQTDVRTSAEALWEHNPHLTKLRDGEPGVESIDVHYPLIHQSNQRPYHFLHGYTQFLEQRLGVRIPVTRFAGDIHLSAEEKSSPPLNGHSPPEKFWIIVAGGKYDFTAKWWNPASYQQVVDHFRGRLEFVQCGEAGHWHPPLTGVQNLVGKTSLRELIRLMHFADGVVCPVTFAMHLSAAVETRPGRIKHRPCVVIAGGREPPHWEAYPHHQYISTVGTLTCCADGGCWKSRCQLVGDGDDKDRRNVCEQPVQVSADLRIPRCLEMITPEDVIRRIELYLAGDLLHPPVAMVRGHSNPSPQVATVPISAPIVTRSVPTAPPKSATPIRLRFQHGLGDCAYFAHLLPLYIRRGYQIEVECTSDKRLLFEAAGATVFEGRAPLEHVWGYPAGGTHEGHGEFWQGSKIGHNISESPLPNIGPKGELWNELCQTRIDIRPHLAAAVKETARQWLAKVPRPVVLFHQKGNTGQARKSLSDAVAAAYYEAFLDRCDGTLVLLDWDQRVPRLASYRIRHLEDFGSCPLELLLALMTEADLLIGVDSGPLHLSRFTNIPTLGVWQPGHYPSTYTLPRPEQLNVVLADHTRQWNRFKRIPWNLVEHTGPAFDPVALADLTLKMLSPSRYWQVAARDLELGEQPTQAQDVQLQQFVREKCRCNGTSNLAKHWDRQRSLDALLQETGRRFAAPTIVETGTIRAEEDFDGAGFFTYLAGTFVARHGGKLHSVDLSPTNVDFARTWTAVFGERVVIHQGNSVQFLRSFTDPIDVLYLDSLDTTEAHHAAHCQQELESASAKLHAQSLICIDDTPWQAGAFIGKGASAVPWLLNHGWRVLYAGYQVVLERASD